MIETFFSYFGLGNEYWTFFPYWDMAFFFLKMFYLRVDGMGWDGMGRGIKKNVELLLCSHPPTQTLATKHQ